MQDTPQLGYLLVSTCRQFLKRFEVHAAPLGFTLAQCKVLGLLSKHPGISQARLADLADLEPMAVVRLLDRMEADGLIERRVDAQDRRARRLHLCRKTASMLEKIIEVGDTALDEALAGFSAAQRKQLETLLARMHANLCGDAPDDCGLAPPAGGQQRRA